jgi:hypothetical protein
LPVEVAKWLLRLTPAAAFAIQQSIPAYPQVYGIHGPSDGYFPLPPWVGLGVLLLWAGVVLALAARRFRRDDA